MQKQLIWTIVVVAIIAISVWFAFDKPQNTSTVKMGALLPLSGKFANLGEDIRNGLELAKNEIKVAKGMNFEIVYEDSAADPKVALPAAQKLITVDKVPFVFGGPGSSGNLAV